MLCLGGLLALDITTTTPDALCPPLAEVRAAVEQRVGEVRGDYHAKFSLIRGDGGRRALELVLFEGERQVLLRELALEDTECQVAAQTIALVLERYFDAVERPATAEPEPEPEPVPKPVPVPGPRTESVPTTPAKTSVTPAHSESDPPVRALRVQAGLAYDWELGLAPVLGAAYFPGSWRLAPNLAAGVALDLGLYVRPKSETVREERLSASTLRAALYVPLALRLGPWSTWLGPWGQLSFQRAHGESLVHARDAYRTLPGLGGFLRLGWSPARAWTLAAGAAAGGQLLSAGSRIVLQRADGGRNQVLVPETWFGQAQLTLSTML
jgi:hypothetical protein